MKRYDKSQIMKRAWHIYNHSFSVSFSEALKEAWRRAKQEATMREKAESRTDRPTEYDRRNARLFANVRFGRDDWSALYGRKHNF